MPLFTWIDPQIQNYTKRLFTVADANKDTRRKWEQFTVKLV